MALGLGRADGRPAPRRSRPGLAAHRGGVGASRRLRRRCAEWIDESSSQARRRRLPASGRCRSGLLLASRQSDRSQPYGSGRDAAPPALEEEAQLMLGLELPDDSTPTCEIASCRGTCPPRSSSGSSPGHHGDRARRRFAIGTCAEAIPWWRSPPWIDSRRCPARSRRRCLLAAAEPWATRRRSRRRCRQRASGGRAASSKRRAWWRSRPCALHHPSCAPPRLRRASDGERRDVHRVAGRLEDGTARAVSVMASRPGVRRPRREPRGGDGDGRAFRPGERVGWQPRCVPGARRSAERGAGRARPAGPRCRTSHAAAVGFDRALGLVADVHHAASGRDVGHGEHRCCGDRCGDRAAGCRTRPAGRR